MGYLDLVTPSNRNWVFCEDVYPFRIRVEPGFASDLELQTIIKDEIPDVEEWQFSGRRFTPRPRVDPQNPLISPSRYAQNSRKVRQFTEIVVFAFHSSLDRADAAARLTSEGFTFTLQDEPVSGSNTDQSLVIILP